MKLEIAVALKLSQQLDNGNIKCYNDIDKENVFNVD